MADLYAVIMTHPSNTCPLSNETSRELIRKAYSEMPKLYAKHKVKVTAQYQCSTSTQSLAEHIGIMIVEADNTESIRDLMVEGGFIHWCSIRIYPVTHTELFIAQLWC